MGISPAYTIHQYREDIYKVVAFKGVRDPDAAYIRDRGEERHYDSKLNEAFCRAKSMVLQYALCNPWDYFFTGTLDASKFNRYELDTYQQRLTPVWMPFVSTIMTSVGQAWLWMPHGISLTSGKVWSLSSCCH